LALPYLFSMNTPAPSLTVYFDGACPLCTAEIRLYRRCRGADAIAWVDVSQDDPADLGDLDRDAARARVHVRDGRGRLTSGAAGFFTLWAHLPGWHRLAWLRHIPGVAWLAEGAYRMFLPLRPWIARRFRRRASCDGACSPHSP
jgi:predicted DCC family thiol-disulfide oxidoreductase YuxK